MTERMTLLKYVGSLGRTASPDTSIPLRVLFDIYDEEMQSPQWRPRAEVSEAELQRVIRLNDSGACTGEEAADMLGISRRTFFRRKKQYADG